jgi:hypothetical protein
MTFDERNAGWKGIPSREFRQIQTRSSSPRVWSVQVEGRNITTVWGQLGGAMQVANEIANGVNIGKKNEVSPEDYALYLGREKCRKKHWEGYREIDAQGNFLDQHVAEVDFDNPPLNLCFWKPDNSPGAGILKKAEAKKVIYVRKMNGLMFCAWSNSKGQVFLTSRKMLRQQDDEVGTNYTWNDRFPHLIQAMEMPPRSLILGELIAFDKNNRDNLHTIESYTKSLTPRALEDQAKNGWAWFYMWGVAFWDGQNFVSDVPLGAQYELITSKFANKFPIIHPQIVKPGQYEGFETPAHFRKLAEQWGWEGFVMVDPDAPLGDRGMNFKGKPDRPGKVAAKVKPEYEDDFVVFWDPEKGYGEYSTKGRYGGKGMESACLYQYNSKGELIYIANCGSGLTEEMKTNAHPSQFPQVWKIKYTERRYQSDGDKTNALDHPRLDSPRTDKKPDECINPKL